MRNRAAVTRLAQSNGNFANVIASAGLDKSVFFYDTTVVLSWRCDA